MRSLNLCQAVSKPSSSWQQHQQRQQKNSNTTTTTTEYLDPKDLEVLKLVQKNGLRLRHASEIQKSKKVLVWNACKQNGNAIQFASTKLQGDSEIVSAALHQGLQINSSLLPQLRTNFGFMKVAVQQRGSSLQYASPTLKRNIDIVQTACQQDWRALEFASLHIKANKEFIKEICWKYSGLALQFATDDLRNDYDLVVQIVQQYGSAIQYASDTLRATKQVVLIATTNDPDSLKYSLNGLNQDRDCLVAAQLWDKEYDHHDNSNNNNNYHHDNKNNHNDDNDNHNDDEKKDNQEQQQQQHSSCHKETPTITVPVACSDDDNESNNSSNNIHDNTNVIKIVLSTRFSLAEHSNSIATQFTALLKQYICTNLQQQQEGEGTTKYVIYSPNAFSKGTCDPQWTRLEWPCRGTFESCFMENPSLKIGTPQIDCCWRYSFRYQLVEAKRTNGFMIQLVDYDSTIRNHSLGKGQQIETEMAQTVGTKIFRIYQPQWNYQSRKFTSKDIDTFWTNHVQPLWYNNNSTTTTTTTSTHRGRNSKVDIRLSYF